MSSAWKALFVAHPYPVRIPEAQRKAWITVASGARDF